jgi:hypothetical protein
MDPPNSYRISGSGKGGPAGSASGGANVKLEPAEGGTLLTYDVDAKVAGKIAQLGARLIDGTAASLAEKFFDNFTAELSPVDEEEAAAPATPATTSFMPAIEPRVYRTFIFAGFIFLAGIILYLFKN